MGFEKLIYKKDYHTILTLRLDNGAKLEIVDLAGAKRQQKKGKF